ncbi:class I SAM-dependent methyltransferase [Dyella sp.]|uniref:class I SAM-dependent methyltransferase n=1 Tax=Dyella sp. TaxID=1869338 RepID=UPI002ED02EE3
MSFTPEQDILAVWHDNAAPWIAAIQERRIESRRLITDQAIIDAVLKTLPRRVLDVGCGEGWLARRLMQAGLEVTGVDAVAELVEAACEQGGHFRQLSYEQLAAGELGETFDVAVCNFSLLGKDSVDSLLKAMSAILCAQGVLIIQTLHPMMADLSQPYRDGWREGSWAGCGDGFGQAAPWYFRTLAGWQDSFVSADLRLTEVMEPLHPQTGRPASIIFTLSPMTHGL